MAVDTNQELREVPPNTNAQTAENQPPEPTVPPNIEELANPLEHVAGLPNVEVYKGRTNKMDVFNNGESGQDRSVTFQLKSGVQKDSFALAIDSKDQSRVINLDDSRKIDSMSESDLESVALLQKQGEKLVVSKNNQTWEVEQEDLVENSLVVPLDDETGVEIRNFDPNQNSITVHKVKLGLVPPSTILSSTNKIESVPSKKEGPINWTQRLISVIGVPAVAAAILSGNSPENTQPPPQPAVERPISETSSTTSQELDESLQCPATTEVEFKKGDFLTKALVDINGLARYEDANGKLDLDRLYNDLSCLLVVPENIQVLEKTDPAVADFIKQLFDKDNIDRIGAPTAERIFDGLKKLNESRINEFPNASSQLVIVHEGSVFLIPTFKIASSTGPRPPFPEEPIHEPLDSKLSTPIDEKDNSLSPLPTDEQPDLTTTPPPTPGITPHDTPTPVTPTESKSIAQNSVSPEQQNPESTPEKEV